MPDTIKIERSVTIPEGWFKVTDDSIQKNDKFLNLYTLKFDNVTEEDLADGHSTWFECLIRKQI